MKKINDLNIIKTQPLMTPKKLKSLYKSNDVINDNIYKNRKQIRNILHNKDKRLLAIIGPCSIHNINSAMAYAVKLNNLRKKLKDKFFIIMRVYFEKPRTTIGWKGLITDPMIDSTYDIEKGLKLARRLLLDINKMEMPCATEMLDPIIPQYIADLISWAAIGARTTESQTHRELASGLSFPVGFKNSTDGNIKIAINAMISSMRPHHFVGIDNNGKTSVLRTSGNKDAHIILRGGTNIPNYYEESIEVAEKLIKDSQMIPAIIIDCSHGNSSNNYKRQRNVLKSVIDQKNGGNTSIKGIMLESNLKEGNQKLDENLNNIDSDISITDKCLGWEETEEILLNAYNLLK